MSTTRHFGVPILAIFLGIIIESVTANHCIGLNDHIVANDGIRHYGYAWINYTMITNDDILTNKNIGHNLGVFTHF